VDEKKGWTINGRPMPSESPTEPRAPDDNAVAAAPGRPRAGGTSVKFPPAASPSDVAQPQVIATMGSASPLDRLLADRSTFSAEEEAEIARAMARHHVDRDHPVIQVVVEMLLYRRGFTEILAKMTAAAEATGALLEATRVDPAARATAPAARATAPAAHVSPPAAAGRTAIVAMIATIVIVVAIIGGIVGRSVGSVEQDAALRARSPQIATLLTTATGAAALQLVRDNGNALPSILRRCHRFSDHGRPAETCSVWTEGTGVPLTPMTVYDYTRRTVLALPAWPVALILFVLLGFRVAWRKGRTAAGKAARGW